IARFSFLISASKTRWHGRSRSLIRFKRAWRNDRSAQAHRASQRWHDHVLQPRCHHALGQAGRTVLSGVSAARPVEHREDRRGRIPHDGWGLTVWRPHASATPEAAPHQATQDHPAWPGEGCETMTQAFDSVKVFSATMKQQRDELGETVTRWLDSNEGITLVDTVVTQSSDEAFHCIAITIFYNRAR